MKPSRATKRLLRSESKSLEDDVEHWAPMRLRRPRTGPASSEPANGELTSGNSKVRYRGTRDRKRDRKRDVEGDLWREICGGRSGQRREKKRRDGREERQMHCSQRSPE